MSGSGQGLPSQTQASPVSICLCMIVKNEADFLPRCLASVRGVIDHWVICDTGSTDGTQDLVRRELAGIPGELYKHEWVDFGTNRTRSLQLARGKADYLLVVDADTTPEVEPGRLDSLDADAYALRHVDELSFGYRTCMVRDDREWRYVGAVHEHIHSDEPYDIALLDGVSVRAWFGYATAPRDAPSNRATPNTRNSDGPATTDYAKRSAPSPTQAAATTPGAPTFMTAPDRAAPATPTPPASSAAPGARSSGASGTTTAPTTLTNTPPFNA